MSEYLFFDHAATTCCCRESMQAISLYACDRFGNPSSSHAFGREAAQAVDQARRFFADTFDVAPSQIIFTGSGTEADNLAICGPVMAALAATRGQNPQINVVVSSIEHPAVHATAQSLQDLGVEVRFAPVNSQGLVTPEALQPLVDARTVLVSIMAINNIMGAVQPIELLATAVKKKNPRVIFHTDAIQAFGKIPLPKSGSGIDLISISGHKIEGPKGIGALAVLDPELLAAKRLRPILWGGGQEGGLRSGTQSPPLIVGFHVAAERALGKMAVSYKAVQNLNREFRKALQESGLLAPAGPLAWNSPDSAVPHIVSLSAPGYPSRQIAKLLEERGCIVATGSACSAGKAPSADASLKAMGLSPELCMSSLRISFAADNTVVEARTLARCLGEVLGQMESLLRGA